ncbi:hypothetical protein [Novosphingobium lentum]|uniref:hypothetical protein n=1 Tax=Novosphingobium lentum TaxID=145287 RepID=UPI0008307EBD|nr:hypothetical protein [Novosphingobium lentum]
MPAITRAALAYLAVTGLVVGIWACGFPALFYSAFPGFGLTWVSVDGPYNQHLVRDTGAAYLMVGGLAGLGLLRPLLVTPFAVGFATLLFNLPHFAYHMTHLGMYGPVDKVLNVVALLGAVLCSAWLMTGRAQVRR